MSRPDGSDRLGAAAGDEDDGGGEAEEHPSSVTPGTDAAAEAEPDPAPTGNLIGPVEQPDLPEVARYESRVRTDLESSVADAADDLKSAFVACVVLANLALFGVSLGLMLIGFRGNWRIGGALVAVGLVAGIRAYRRYRTWESSRGGGDGNGDGDADPDTHRDPDPGHDPDATTTDADR